MSKTNNEIIIEKLRSEVERLLAREAELELLHVGGKGSEITKIAKEDYRKLKIENLDLTLKLEQIKKETGWVEKSKENKKTTKHIPNNKREKIKDYLISLSIGILIVLCVYIYLKI